MGGRLKALTGAATELKVMTKENKGLKIELHELKNHVCELSSEVIDYPCDLSCDPL